MTVKPYYTSGDQRQSNFDEITRKPFIVTGLANEGRSDPDFLTSGRVRGADDIQIDVSRDDSDLRMSSHVPKMRITLVSIGKRLRLMNRA
jgi:hypothetical protein